MKGNLFLIFFSQLVFTSLFCGDLANQARPRPFTKLNGITYFILLENPNDTNIANEIKDRINRIKTEDDEIIIDREFGYSKCHNLHVITYKTNDGIPDQLMEILRSKISNSSADGFYIPVKTYQVNDKDQVTIKTTNELRVIINPKTEPIKRQKINTEIKDNKIVIYRDENNVVINRIIWKIKTKDQHALFSFLRQEGIIELLNTVNCKRH